MARFALSVILSCIMASAVAAQDAIPETPPELRDFRLDPVRPAAQPPAEVQPPPVVRTVEPEVQPATPRAERRASSEPRQTPRPAASETAGVATVSSDAIEPPAEASADPEIDMPPSESAGPRVEALPSQPASSGTPWWQIVAAFVAAILALLAGWLYFRRRTAASEFQDVQPAKPLEPAAASFIAPKPVLAAAALKSAPRPRIALEFIPAKATLGFNALTLKGQLRLVNQGDAPAKDMQLRATMISANQRQNETIAAFHNGAIDIAPNALGDAKQGEQLALDIEVSVPVTELESYTVSGRKIFVPLMLANLQYEWDGGKDSTNITCMIGRETEPPQTKMGPLRLDLGPRSFAPLGQRPVYA